MKNLLAILVSSMLFGCAAMDEMSKPSHDPAFAPAEAVAYQAPLSDTGSIYQAGYDMRLFEDIRARRVGDILEVNLVERTDASKESDTAITKDTTTSVSVPTILGKDDPSILGYNFNSSLGSGHDFSGESESNQNNSLQGSISVHVVDVLPNGNLKIRGEKRISLNQGNEYVRVSGLVRPADINPDNSVDSTKIADATIMYTGEGAVADANKIGWLARFFVSAFFPF